ncbi:FAD-dependent oxidoreductase [Falsiroseomonas sp. HW251]|uniref:FAD-dependent oxidoreductase n=1 Tax=Falsiroseomonas sp. HW251 TaxID=3390998 RepID=UPI003D31B824
MHLIEPERRTPILAEADVVILGGGPAGIAAAIAAARDGARTLLLERYGFLGGMGTAGGVTSFCGLYANVHGERVRVTRGVADDLLARLERLGALHEPHAIMGRTWGQAYDNAAMKCIADDAVLAAGATIRFHTLAVGAAMEGERIVALLIETKSGRGAVTASVFIDCSGDADLAHWAGAPTEKGDDDGFVAYPTMMFRMGHVDDERGWAEGKPSLRARLAAAQAAGRTDLPRLSASINRQPHAGEWRSNATQISVGARPVDGTDWLSFSEGEIAGRRQVRSYFDFYKAEVPGFEQAYLLEIAPQLGIRETRRLVGRHVIGEEEILAGGDVPDAIGVNGWPIERHTRGDTEWRFTPGRGFHQLGFAALLPRGVANLLVAGRCASATAIGQSSIRVTGPCYVMGQAAGTAAAMAVRAGVPVAGLDIAALQRRLVEEGAFLG